MGGMAAPYGGMMGPMGPQQMGAAMGYAGRPGMPGGMSMAYGGPPGGPAGAYGGAPGGYYGGGPGGGYGGGPRPTKAQLRNKEADLADPDFRRGRCEVWGCSCAGCWVALLPLLPAWLLLSSERSICLQATAGQGRWVLALPAAPAVCLRQPRQSGTRAPTPPRHSVRWWDGTNSRGHPF